MNETVLEAQVFQDLERLAVRPTPPVHPNCRCIIGPDNIWTDAGDARVCIYCMTLGASWNLRQDIPPDDQEISEFLDKQGREGFRKAIERDSTVADAVIADAAEISDGGILADTPISIAAPGETLTVRVEREATRRLAHARARAPIQPLARVPGMTPIPEAVEFVPAPRGRKMPTVVSVVVAETPTHRVVRKLGRYYVQTRGGRTLAVDDTLALALLILVALAENERRKREQRDSQKI